MQALWLSFPADQADPTRNMLPCIRERPSSVWWEAAAWLLWLLMLVILSQHDKRSGQGCPKGQHKVRITPCVCDSTKRNRILGNKSNSLPYPG